MCGRFALSAKTEDVEKLVKPSRFTKELVSRYNIAPSQKIHILRNNSDNIAEEFRWGLIPSWAKDISIANKMINARSESLSEKPAFRNLLKSKRCLIYADGFYEWRKGGRSKIPYFIHFKDSRPFTFAGLWDKWISPDGEIIESAVIITTEPNSVVAPIHNRMPVILKPEFRKSWLYEDFSNINTEELLIPCNPDEMEAFEVSTMVNSPVNDSPECIQAPEGRLF